MDKGKQQRIGFGIESTPGTPVSPTQGPQGDLVLLDGPLSMPEWVAQQDPAVGALWAAYLAAVVATHQAATAYHLDPTPHHGYRLAEARRAQAQVEVVCAPLWKAYGWYNATYPRKWAIPRNLVPPWMDRATS